MDENYNELDNQTNISDITDKTISSENLEEFRQKREEINKILKGPLIYSEPLKYLYNKSAKRLFLLDQPML